MLSGIRIVPSRYSKFYFHLFLENDHKSAQICTSWFRRLPNMFENVFEVICDHMIHGSNLEDFPGAKKYNITKVRCQERFCEIHKNLFFLWIISKNVCPKNLNWSATPTKFWFMLAMVQWLYDRADGCCCESHEHALLLWPKFTPKMKCLQEQMSERSECINCAPIRFAIQ